MRYSNGTWYGYCIDLLRLIKDEMPEGEKFDYELYEVKDGRYGTKNLKTGKWDGAIGELAEKVQYPGSPLLTIDH